MEFQVNVTKLGLFAYYLSYLLLLIYMAVLEDVGHNADLYFVFSYRQQSRGQHAKLGTWPVQSFVQRQSTKL